MEKIQKIIDQITDLSKSKKRITVFLIGNTSKVEDVEYFLMPSREYNQVLVAGAIVYSELIAKKIAENVDGFFDYIFVDSEKKIPDRYSINLTPCNIERVVKETVNISKLLTYKANDLSVDAADSFISEYFLSDISGVGGKKITIIGAGNIGSKLGMKLVERGSDVTLYRRNSKKLDLIVSYINTTKSEFTVASAHRSKNTLDACKNADVIIGATAGGAISKKVIASANNKTLILDVGKGSLSKDALLLAHMRKMGVYRLSVDSAIEGMVLTLISTHKSFNNKVGRNNINGIKVVSGGLVAREDEFVVDDYLNPMNILGLGDGSGDFNRKPSKAMMEMFNNLEKFINEKQKSQ